MDCTRARYRNAKAAPHSATGKTAALTKWDLCPTCFLDGRFPQSSSAVDMTELKWTRWENERYATLPERDAVWADAELLLLLEGLELFDDDWNAVADHVGSRTREECVLKFLQLEIEDKYLEPDPPGDAAHANNPTNGLGYLSYGRVPFSQTDNPVLSVVGFLAGLAEPEITAVAAGRTVEEMRRSLRNRLERGEGTDKAIAEEEARAAAQNDGAATTDKDKTAAADASAAPEAVKTEGDDPMDVDAAATTAPSQPGSTTAVATGPAADQTSSTAAAASQPAGNPLITIPLALSAARGAALASNQERQITRLVSTAVNLQLQKLELKLTQFSEMESMLAAERRDLERRRQQLFLDRLAFKKRVRAVEEELAGLSIRAATAAGMQESAVGMSLWEKGVPFGKAVEERLGVERAGLAGQKGGAEMLPLGVDEQGYKSLEI